MCTSAPPGRTVGGGYSVKDNGIGIAPQYQKQVFGIFKRLDAKGGKYSGQRDRLGDLPEDGRSAMGGRIWIESELGQGATFHFTVPAIRGGT